MRHSPTAYSTTKPRTFHSLRVLLGVLLLAAPCSLSAQVILGNYQTDFSNAMPQSTSTSKWRYYWVNANASGGLTTWSNYNLMGYYTGSFWASQNPPPTNYPPTTADSFVRLSLSGGHPGPNQNGFQTYAVAGFKVDQYGGTPFSIINSNIRASASGTGLTINVYTRSPSNVLTFVNSSTAAPNATASFNFSLGSPLNGSEILVLVRSTGVFESVAFTNFNFSVIPEPSPAAMILGVGLLFAFVRISAKHRKANYSTLR